MGQPATTRGEGFALEVAAVMGFVVAAVWCITYLPGYADLAPVWATVPERTVVVSTRSAHASPPGTTS